MKHTHRSHAFSLVEVALSLGIVAFAVTGIMELMATAVNSGKASTDDTIITDMASGLVNDLRHQYFMDAGQGRMGGGYGERVVNGFGVLAGTDDVPAGKPPAEATSYVFFDVGGARLQSGSPAADLSRDDALLKGAIYQCKVLALADDATLSASSTAAPPASTARATNLLRMTLVFTWPVGAATANSTTNSTTNSKTVHATLARY